MSNNNEIGKYHDIDIMKALECGNIDELKEAIRELIEVLQGIDEEAKEYAAGIDPNHTEWMKGDYLEPTAGIMRAADIVISQCWTLLPSMEKLATDFSEAIDDYNFGRAATLDDAFGYKRPDNWRQTSEIFRRDNSLQIVRAIRALRRIGTSVEDAFDLVSKQCNKSSSSIKSIYYKRKQLSKSASEAGIRGAEARRLREASSDDQE